MSMILHGTPQPGPQHSLTVDFAILKTLLGITYWLALTKEHALD